jgi:hypothetical protein
MKNQKSEDNKISEYGGVGVSEEKTSAPRYADTPTLAFCLLVSVFWFLSSGVSAHAFDVKGLQPLSPYGVFSTFSAESLKQNQAGFALGIEKSSSPNFYRTNFNFAYGLHDKFEFNMSLPYVSGWKGIDGFEDINFGIKHRLVDETLYSPALAYMLMVSVPTGRDEFSTDGRIGAGLLLTKKIGPFRGHANVIYSNPMDSALRNEYSVNLGAELAIAHDSRVLVEIIGRKNYFKNRIDLLEWRMGYRVATTDNIFTTIGAGFDIKDRSPDYRLMFSISIILPKEKEKIQKIYKE